MVNSDLNASKMNSVSWFEFLLNPSLLEGHLAKENPDPCATDLIIQFLANALLPKDREQTTFPPVSILPVDKTDSNDSPEGEKTNGIDTKKTTALKLLALKVAAHLKWDLTVLQSNLPIPMQNSLLLYLLQVTSGRLEKEDEVDTSFHVECDLCSLSSQAFFAINLYHRWSSRMVSPESVSTRPSKALPIALPGSQDPTVVSPVVVELIMKSIYNKLEHTQTVLERSLAIDHDVCVPSYHSFGVLHEEKEDVEYFWERGIVIDCKEIVCQTAFDLGCLYFFKSEYKLAGKLFFQSLELFEEMKEPKFCCIDERVLRGYCAALAGVLKKSVVLSSQTLLERLDSALRDNVDDVVAVLLIDNIKREIGLAFRETTLSNLHTLRSKLSPAAFSELYFKVLTLNVIRTVLDGRAFSHEYVKAIISKGEAGAQFLRDSVLDVIPHANFIQKENVANFVKYICKVTYRIIPEVGKLLNISTLLGSPLNLKDCEEPEVPFKGGLTSEQIQSDFSGHGALQLGELEVQFQTTYEPRLIYDMIPRLHSFGLRRPAWLITKRWELPNPLHSLILELPQGFSQEAIYVFLAKARELARLKRYLKARCLLEVADREANDSFKLVRSIRWEMLLMDLLHVQSLIGVQTPDENWVQDLANQAKHCITVYIQEKGSDFLPRQDLVEECGVFLLNCQHWEFLGTLEIPGRNCLEFTSILARTCGEVKVNKGARKAIRELWDAVLPMFATSVGQHKRGQSGIPSLVARETPYTILPRHEFCAYFEKIKDKSILSILVSLLSKIHNILKDDANNNVNYDQSVTWPTVISSSCMFGIHLVQDTMSSLLNHCLSVYPVSIPWIKAKADLNYVLGHHANSVRFYVEAAMISSGHFADPIPRSVLDETSLRRMIRCCSQLQCHTQAAILCQFLDDVDYATAFKALQEKNSQDAMDVYYSCIWDLNILEFLVHIHTKRGELSKKDFALKLIGQLELNANNNAEIQREASNLRRSRFMRAMMFEKEPFDVPPQERTLYRFVNNFRTVCEPPSKPGSVSIRELF